MTSPVTNTETTIQAPPGNNTKLVAPQPKKKIKLRMLRDAANPFSADKTNPEMFIAGSIVEVDVDIAKELLSRKYPGNYAFSGQRDSIERLAVIKVAERYVEPEPKLDDLEQA